jgi:hypothetical protein
MEREIEDMERKGRGREKGGKGGGDRDSGPKRADSMALVNIYPSAPSISKMLREGGVRRAGVGGDP